MTRLAIIGFLVLVILALASLTRLHRDAGIWRQYPYNDEHWELPHDPYLDRLAGRYWR